MQIVATNDFHGRLPTAGDTAGAVGQWRAEDPDLLFVGVGDQLGASPFDSAIAQDRPTIEVMNALDMAVSAAGNHEYDAGHDDVMNRIGAPHDAELNPFGGAQWPHIAANLRHEVTGPGSGTGGGHALAEPGRGRDGATWTAQVEDVTVGFVGAVTESLPLVVSPAALRGLEVTSIVAETNAAAARLRAEGADVVILLVHEGAAGTTEQDMVRAGTPFGEIVTEVSDDVDVILSGHTHLPYAHTIEGRPVLSGGAFGEYLSRVVLDVDPATDEVQVDVAELVRPDSVVPVAASALALQDEVQAVVAAAQSQAHELGSRVLGSIQAPARRAVMANGRENRGAESTASNLVAESHRWATSHADQGGAQIAFMNPGGVRTDLIGDASNGYPAPVTMREAASVQPFANTLINMRMTGAQLKEVLEEQWQVDEAGVPLVGRPVRHLGVSRGFTWTYDPSRPQGDRILSMWLHDAPVDLDATYAVTVHTFLADGGDGFTSFTRGTERHDTGQTDLMATTAYLAAHVPAQIDTTHHSVGLRMPSRITEGGTVTGQLSSWSFTAVDSIHDDAVEVFVDGQRVGSFPIDHTVDETPTDESGRARFTFTAPKVAARAGAKAGARTVTVEFVGRTTGTRARARLEIVKAADAAPEPTAQVRLALTGTQPGRVRGPVDHRGPLVRVVVLPQTGPGGVARRAGGRVELRRDGVRVARATVVGGYAQLRLPMVRRLGAHRWRVVYTGDQNHRATSRGLTSRAESMRPVLKVRTRNAKGRITVVARAGVPRRVVGPSTLAGRVRVVAVHRSSGGEVLRREVRNVRLRDGVARLRFEAGGSGSVNLTVRRAAGPRTVAVTRSVRVKLS